MKYNESDIDSYSSLFRGREYTERGSLYSMRSDNCWFSATSKPRLTNVPEGILTPGKLEVSTAAFVK